MRTPEGRVPARWRSIQEDVARRVERRDRFRKPPRDVGGVDVAFTPDRAVAAAVLLHAETLEVLHVRTRSHPVTAPYIPGFLSFREAAVAMAAVRALPVRPDVLFVDGSGTIHPRGAGLACHVGVRLDMPTVGVAKALLCGTVQEAGLRARGDRAPVMLAGRVAGYAVRTSDGARRPVYVSTGHRVSLATAAELSVAFSRTRIPEPTRQADAAARRAKDK